MKRPQATQILGWVALLGGGWWLWGGTVQILLKWIRHLEEDFGIESLFFGFFFITTAGIGVVMVVGGINLIRNWPAPQWLERADLDEEERLRVRLATDSIASWVRWVLGMFALFAVLSFSAYLEKPLNGRLPESILSTVLTFAGTLIVVPIYIWLVRFFLRRRGYPANELRGVIGKAGIFLIAMQLWLVLSSIGELEFFSTKGTAGRSDLAFEMLCVFGPIVAAWLFYKLAVRALRINELEVDLRRAGVDPGSANR